MFQTKFIEFIKIDISMWFELCFKLQMVPPCFCWTRDSYEHWDMSSCMKFYFTASLSHVWHCQKSPSSKMRNVISEEYLSTCLSNMYCCCTEVSRPSFCVSSTSVCTSDKCWHFRCSAYVQLCIKECWECVPGNESSNWISVMWGHFSAILWRCVLKVVIYYLFSKY